MSWVNSGITASDKFLHSNMESGDKEHIVLLHEEKE